ncbi:MAG TPA: methylated-DNA--[protein]-cysteine S-methyltransferase [Actinomycetota bacterium]|nr:methylated-DNA--[protein]-cysteine S-methyltransferase [Actinomycetota bacterium]
MTSDAAAGSRRAARRIGDAADAAGLVDVAYGTVDTPIGALLVAVSRRGVVRVAFEEEIDDTVIELSDDTSVRVLRSARGTDEVRRQVEEYFGGSRHEFDVGVDWSELHGFTRKVLRETARIPFGSVLTYREVAGRAGNSRAMRAAGNALHANPVPIVVPCHRVIRTGGGLGGYGGRLDRKEALLRMEGALL